jgi:hypothetical protein
LAAAFIEEIKRGTVSNLHATLSEQELQDAAAVVAARMIYQLQFDANASSYYDYFGRKKSFEIEAYKNTPSGFEVRGQAFGTIHPSKIAAANHTLFRAMVCYRLLRDTLLVSLLFLCFLSLFF